MLSWLAPLLVLGLVIFVHELGHFLAAKWAGVYAPRFSLGWGNPVWSFRRGETEYAISALPIGGYVRMASKEDEAASALEGGPELKADGSEIERSKHWDEHLMIPHGPKPIPPDRWFESKPLYKRLVIMLAGVVMNAILAVVVSVGLFLYYGRGYVPAVIETVVAERAAAVGGMQVGDSVVSIDGVSIKRWDELVERVSASPETAMTFVVQRGTEQLTLQITPEAQEAASPETGAMERVGRIGVGPRPKAVFEDLSFGEAVRSGVAATGVMATNVLDVLGGLFRGNVSVSQLGGPVEIARASVSAAQTGAENLWALVAFLSINLAILNLLPIPLLDGGQIVLNVVESAVRRPLPAAVKEWYARLGLAAILLLFVTVTFNDLKRLVLGWFGGD